MKDERKIRRLKKILLILGILFGIIFTFLLGSSTGYYRGVKKMEAIQTKVHNKNEKKKEILLTQAEVQKFLIAYYTKEDLGENQNRYKPFMTDSLYKSTVDEEQLPINQAYKGYVVHQVFQKATIYIDQKNHTAVCLVSFKNTQRVKKGSDDRALKNQTNQQNIKLSYQLLNGRYKVNQISPVIMDENVTELDKNSYPSDRIQLPNQMATENVDKVEGNSLNESNSSSTVSSDQQTSETTVSTTDNTSTQTSSSSK